MWHSAKERKLKERELIEQDRQKTMEAAVGAHAQYPGGDQPPPPEEPATNEATRPGMPSGEEAWRQQQDPHAQEAWPQPTSGMGGGGSAWGDEPPRQAPPQQSAWPEPQREPPSQRGRQDSYHESSPRGSFDSGRRQDSYEGRGSFDGGRQGYGGGGYDDRGSRGGYDRMDDRRDDRRYDDRPQYDDRRERGSFDDGRGPPPQDRPARDEPRRSSQTSRYRGNTGWQNPFHEGGGY